MLLALKATTLRHPFEASSKAHDRPQEETSFARTLERLGKAANESESAMSEIRRRAASGRDFSPAELLALQSSVYRFSEVVDLSTRFIERAANAAKVVLSGQ